jgi:hypothetical protein
VAGWQTVVRFKRCSYDHKDTYFSSSVEHWKEGRQLKSRSIEMQHIYMALLRLRDGEVDKEFWSEPDFRSLKWRGHVRPTQSRVEGTLLIYKYLGNSRLLVYQGPIVLYQKRALGERLDKREWLKRPPPFRLIIISWPSP